MFAPSIPHSISKDLLPRLLSIGPGLSAADHDAWLELDRSTYAAMLLQPIAPREAMAIIVRLLSVTHANRGPISNAQKREEDALIDAALPNIPAPIAIASFEELITRRVNNQRSSTYLRSFVFGSPELETWAVTYRAPLRRLITHALGRRTAATCARLLELPETYQTKTQKAFLEQQVFRFALDPALVREVFLHVFGRWFLPTAPLLRAYLDARKELSRGRGLPFKTLQGIAGTFHKKSPHALLKQLTPNTKLKRETGEALDAADDSLIGLIRRAYRAPVATQPMLTELEAALLAASERLPRWNAHVAVVLDASRSMRGVGHRMYNAMSIAAAIAQLIRLRAQRTELIAVGGRSTPSASMHATMIEPAGPTALAPAIVDACALGADCVVVITDGYENAGAGDTARVAEALAAIEFATPIIQLVPAFTEREKLEGLRLSATWPLVQETGLGDAPFEALWLRLMALASPEKALAMIQARAKKESEP